MRYLLLAFTLSVLPCCTNACAPGVPILGYHAIGDSPDGYFTSEKAFAAQLDALKSAGYQTATLHQLLDKKLPPRPIILTFDDGNESCYSRALPALRARGMVATFFVVASYLGDSEATRKIEDQGTPVEKRYLLWPEVQALAAAGMEIGSHSMSHKRLSTLSEAEAEADAKGSRLLLESRLHQPIDLFAYPYNSQRRYLLGAIERAGYRAAVAGNHGLGGTFELQRMSVVGDLPPDELLRRVAALAPGGEKR